MMRRALLHPSSVVGCYVAGCLLRSSAVSCFLFVRSSSHSLRRQDLLLFAPQLCRTVPFGGKAASTALRPSTGLATPLPPGGRRRSSGGTGLGMAGTTSAAVAASATADPALLAEAWAPHILRIGGENDDGGASSVASGAGSDSRLEACRAAVRRTLPFFLGGGSEADSPSSSSSASVPFVCRYRTDVIRPLTTTQVHALLGLADKHRSLASLRARLLGHFPGGGRGDGGGCGCDADAVRRRILTSTSRAELEDLYAPFKPPAKGSLLERIREDHPALVEAVDEMWKAAALGGGGGGKAHAPPVRWDKLGPPEVVAQVLGSKIAAQPEVAWMVADELKRHCRVRTSSSSSAGGEQGEASGAAKAAGGHRKDGSNNHGNRNSNDNKYAETYGNFDGHLARLKDYQVLAIRRGVQEKALKMAFDVDGEKMESFLTYRLRQQQPPDGGAGAVPIVPRVLLERDGRHLLQAAVHDAWTRLLRRRGTTRLWAEKCREAQERACHVFEDNLRRALLAPPLAVPSPPVLALDPGFAAGCKCAILSRNGDVVTLDTVQFVGSSSRRQEGVKALERLIQATQMVVLEQGGADSSTTGSIVVALGNGHGSQEGRSLVEEASANCKIPIQIHLVSEAGASVWSVTETAKREFPKQPPSAIAAISIGRRLQNPLHELVKVPPKSLGLGMYQHDLSDKELDDRLHFTSVDAVATVGVEVNSCSNEILQKVPGLTPGLAEKIIKARPLARRGDLLQVSGLGPKTFENCAGFVRVQDGADPLDDTLIHPESYDLAKWLLKAFSWNLAVASDGKSTNRHPPNLPPRHEWKAAFQDQIAQASDRFHVSRDRVVAVMENLVDSMTNEDPRLRDVSGGNGGSDGRQPTDSSLGSVENCKNLSPGLTALNKLAAETETAPVRGIVGTVRNVADFGAFIDIGTENDGLLHISKIGSNLQLSELMIGQQIGVDVLSVANGSRISLGLHGLSLQPSQPRSANHAEAVRIRGSLKKDGSSVISGKRSVSTKASPRRTKPRIKDGR